jgi:hypothetical protein
VYSNQLKFLSKLINERQSADSLSVDNMEESQVTTVEQNESPRELLYENHEHSSVERESVIQTSF